MSMRVLLLIAIGSLSAASPRAGLAADESAGAAAAADGWRTEVRKLAAEHFKNPAWGYSHSERDYAFAKELAAQDNVKLDDDILYAACLLHDIAAFPPWADPKLDHSDVGAEQVKSILANAGFPMQKVEAVGAAIRTHMYYREPVGPEATYLHDADALDWLGAIGVARILGLIDPNGGSPDPLAAVKMLEDNLAKVPGRVFSPAGKSREAARKAQLEQFLKSLREQTGNLTTL